MRMAKGLRPLRRLEPDTLAMQVSVNVSVSVTCHLLRTMGLAQICGAAGNHFRM